MEIITTDKAQKIPDERTWKNSANVLCNYMKKIQYLEMILKNRAIIPRYVIEPLEYLSIENLYKIAFQMTCFCDIPFSKVSGHMSFYGKYGIAFNKDTFIKKFCIQPIHYINMESPLAKDFRQAFSEYYNSDKKASKKDRVLTDYMVSTLLYMKPLSGIEEIDGIKKRYVYQDECEWRYIPTKNFPGNLKLVLRSEANEKGRDEYSRALLAHEETWIKFDWKDVRYIIVPDDSALHQIIDVIKELPMGDRERYLLISKIEVSARFTEDLV